MACLVRVYRKGAQFPFTASCRFDAYKQGGQMWSKFPETMLAKATTTLALRRGFADVIAGIASADEMDQAGLAAPEALTQGTPAATSAAPNPPPHSEPKPEARKQPVKTPAHKEAEVEKAAVSVAAATGGTVVEAQPEAAAPAGLPARDDLKGALAALYKKAQMKGVTVTGWETLQKQLGENPGARAAKAIPALDDAAKVAFLNEGKSTLGEPITA